MPGVYKRLGKKANERKKTKPVENTQKKAGISGKCEFLNKKICRSVSQPRNGQPGDQAQAEQAELTLDDTIRCGFVFDSLDKDRDGKLNASDITEALLTTNQHVTMDEAMEAINTYDLNGDQAIDFQEFLALVQRNPSCLSEDDELRAAFQRLDRNGDGFIDVDDLKSGMKDLGVTISEKEAQEMIKMGDDNKDGMLNFQEFASVWKAIKKKRDS